MQFSINLFSALFHSSESSIPEPTPEITMTAGIGIDYKRTVSPKAFNLLERSIDE